MKNILLVLTGGTIGSSYENTTINTNTKASLSLVKHYEDNYPNQAQFTTLRPFSLLSEHIKPLHWSQLIQSIKEQALSSYDGIIVTHGTDTLAYTANALDLCFNENLPLVLVSAHLPPENPNTNAHVNFASAVEIIKTKRSGVFVSYQNPNEHHVNIFTASEISQSPQLSSSFYPISSVTALVNKGMLSWKKDISKTLRHSYEPFFNEEILYIKPYPGLNYKNFSLDNVKYILHDLYHSGTCHDQDVLIFLKHCQEKGILLFFTPIKSQEHYYDSTKKLQEAGSHFIFDTSLERSMVLLMHATAIFNHKKSIIEYVKNIN